MRQYEPHLCSHGTTVWEGSKDRAPVALGRVVNSAGWVPGFSRTFRCTKAELKLLEILNLKSVITHLDVLPRRVKKFYDPA